MSQLDLGLEADVSARHISFLETGRAQPSRGMVLRLCTHLGVPRDGRNHLLTAAGLAPAYLRRDRSAEDLKPIERAVAWTLARHAPYPAYSFDRHWRLVDLNEPAGRLLGLVGLGPGDSLMEALLEDRALGGVLVNRQQILAHSLARLRMESALWGGDPVLDDLVRRIEEVLTPGDTPDTLPPFVPTILRLGDRQVSLVSTLAQFGSAEDVALAELRIELMFPVDDADGAILQALAGDQR